MKKTLLILAVVSLLFFTACTTIVADKESVKDLNKISVLGSAQLEVAPDEAELRLSVVTEDYNVKSAQQRNAQIAGGVIDSLVSAGVDKKQIETVGYSVEKVREWEREKYVDKGYRVKNTVKVTTKSLDKVGDFIDSAVGAGANEVQSVSFSLTKDAKEKVKEQLLQKASDDAKSKAKILASALSVSLGRAVTIAESNYDLAPVYYSGALYKSAMMEASAPTPIQPKNIETTARISVVFEIG